VNGKETWNERSIAAALLFVGFLLVIPAVLINAPGMGVNSAWGRKLPLLFDADWQKYWSVAFVVVTLYGLAIFEGILHEAGDHIFSKLGMVTFALASAMWLIGVVVDLNGVLGGRDFESFFIALAFPAVLAYGLAILRTNVLARWIGVAVVLWSTAMLIHVFPHNQGPLFYEPALLLIAVALALTRNQGRAQSKPVELS